MLVMEGGKDCRWSKRNFDCGNGNKSNLVSDDSFAHQVTKFLAFYSKRPGNMVNSHAHFLR